ncbi:hypothetical protein HYY75_06215 [bacterium]|nr:hypothetical protein [bacterium]
MRNITIMLISCFLGLLSVIGCGAGGAALEFLKKGETSLAAKDYGKVMEHFGQAFKCGGLSESQKTSLDKGYFEAYLHEVKGSFIFIALGYDAFQNGINSPSDNVLVEARSNVPVLEKLLDTLKTQAAQVKIPEYQEIHGRLLQATDFLRQAHAEVLAIDKRGQRDLAPAAKLMGDGVSHFNAYNTFMEQKAKQHGFDLSKIMEP